MTYFVKNKNSAKPCYHYNSTALDYYAFGSVNEVSRFAIKNVSYAAWETLNREGDIWPGGGNPERSTVPGSSYNVASKTTENWTLIAMDMGGVINEASALKISLEKTIAITILHGAGHTTGIGTHTTSIGGDGPYISAKTAAVMTDIESIYQEIAAPYRPKGGTNPELNTIDDYAKKEYNEVYIREMKIRYGNNEPKSNIRPK